MSWTSRIASVGRLGGLDSIDSIDVGFLVLGVAPLLLVAVVLVWFRRRRRDEMFVGVTPGELPATGDGIRTRRLAGPGEWRGTVAVRFTPPDDVTPGIAGTVVDGRADQVDISATIIDLAVRGHLTITAVHPQGATRAASPTATPPANPPGTDEPSTAVDWELTRAPSPSGRLRPFEAELLGELFASGPVVRLSALKGSFGMTLRRAQIGLYREVVDRGWYAKHPQDRNKRLWWLGIPMLLLGLLVLGVLLLWPMVRVLNLSLQDYELRNLLRGDTNYVWLDNYREILSDPFLWTTVLPNTVGFAVVTVAATVALGTAVAVFLKSLPVRWRWFATSAVMVAWAVPAMPC